MVQARKFPVFRPEAIHQLASVEEVALFDLFGREVEYAVGVEHGVLDVLWVLISVTHDACEPIYREAVRQPIKKQRHVWYAVVHLDWHIIEVR